MEGQLLTEATGGLVSFGVLEVEDLPMLYPFGYEQDAEDWLVAPYDTPECLAGYRAAWRSAQETLIALSQKKDFSLSGELNWQRAFRACMTALNAYIAAEGDLYDVYTYELEGDYVSKNA
jgi:hypothetical protein